MKQPATTAVNLTAGHALRRASACLLIVAIQASGAAQAADLSQQMAGMFGSGAMANVTGPGAYKSQTQNIYTGGEMQLRFPSRNYQLWSYSLPSVKFGCGGADAYLGSLSHINSAQFKAMLEQVGQAYAGLLFKAALKSINPLIESVIGDMQKTLESHSQNGGSICALAQQAVDATSTMTGMTTQTSCVTASMRIFNEGPDAANKRCKIDPKATNDAAKASADPKIRALADRDINLIWDSMEGSTLSTVEKEIFLNIAGSIVIYKPASNFDAEPKTPTPFEPSIDSLNTLLNGHEPGNSDDEVKINNWLKCPDAQCLAPTRTTATIKPFTTHVRLMLERIRDKAISRTALDATEIQFVNMTAVPVYRLIAMGYTKDSAGGNQDLVNVLINRYAKVISYDYAFNFLRTAQKDAKLYLGMANLRTKPEQAMRDRLLDNINRLMEEVDREHSKALARVRDARGLADDLQAIERDMRMNLPTSIRNMQDIGNLMKGNRG